VGRLVRDALLLVALAMGWHPAAHAQPLPPLDAARAPFAATLSNNTALAIGMNVEDTSRALATALNYISGRPGDEIFWAFRNISGSGLFLHKDRLYLQFRRGRLAGWKGDWGQNWMWQ
jgi:hypothetical protein